MSYLFKRINSARNFVRYKHVRFISCFDWFKTHFITNAINSLLNRKSGKIIAIRREDQSVWERRAPFAPHHVKRLVKNGINVLVQPSNRRAYPMQVILIFLLHSFHTFLRIVCVRYAPRFYVAIGRNQVLSFIFSLMRVLITFEVCKKEYEVINDLGLFCSNLFLNKKGNQNIPYFSSNSDSDNS